MTTLTGTVGWVEQVSDRERKPKFVTSRRSAGGAVADPAQYTETLVGGGRALRTPPGLKPDPENMGFFSVIKRSITLLVVTIAGSGGAASAGFREEEPRRRGLASHDALC